MCVVPAQGSCYKSNRGFTRRRCAASSGRRSSRNHRRFAPSSHGPLNPNCFASPPAQYAHRMSLVHPPVQDDPVLQQRSIDTARQAVYRRDGIGGRASAPSSQDCLPRTQSVRLVVEHDWTTPKKRPSRSYAATISGIPRGCPVQVPSA